MTLETDQKIEKPVENERESESEVESEESESESSEESDLTEDDSDEGNSSEEESNTSEEELDDEGEADKKEYRLENKNLGFYSIVDQDIYEKYKNATLQRTDGYTAIKNQRLSHLVLGKPKRGYVVDHISGIRNDDRRTNLRFATFNVNAHNRKGSGVSKYKGVTLTRKRWQARIGHDHKVIYGGCFEREIDAAYKANILSKQLYGEYAFLNKDDNGMELQEPDGYEESLPKNIFLSTDGKYHVRVKNKVDVFTDTLEKAILILKNHKLSYQKPKKVIDIEIKENYSDHYVCYTSNKNDTFKVSKDKYDQIKAFPCAIDFEGYVVIKTETKRLRLHRYLLNYEGEQIVDHIDGDPGNNITGNLRITTSSVNGQNRKARGLSGFSGVSKTISGTWCARIKKNNRDYYIGKFEDVLLAAWAYNQVCDILYENGQKNNVPDFSADWSIVTSVSAKGAITYRCTEKSTNQHKKNGRSGYFGVHASNKQFQTMYKNVFYGLYDSVELAAWTINQVLKKHGQAEKNQVADFSDQYVLTGTTDRFGRTCFRSLPL